MTEVLNPKVEAYGLVDVLGMALVKQVEERAVAPYIGNATVKSGIIKGVGGGIAHAVLGKNRYGRIVSSAILFDAAEDVISGLLGGVGGGNAPRNEWG